MCFQDLVRWYVLNVLIFSQVYDFSIYISVRFFYCNIYIYSCSILHFHVLYMFNEQQDHWQDDQENPHEASIFCGSKGLLAAPGCLLVIPGVCCHGEWLWSFAGLLPMEFCERSHSFLEMERFVKDALKYGWMMVNVECTTYHIFSVDLFFAHWNQRPSPRTLLFTAEIAATCREAKTWMAWSTNMAIYSKVVDSRISPTILSLHLFQCHGNLWESNNSRHDQGVIQLHQQFPKSLVFLFIKSQVLLVFFVHVKKPNVSKNI